MKRLDAIHNIGELLRRRRAELRRSLELARNQLNSSSRNVGDVIDDVVDSENQEIASRLAQAESDELVRIETALQQMEASGYGVCEACQRKIPLTRLQALPYATLCIQCQRDRESNGAVFPAPQGADALLNGNSVEAF